MGERQLRTGQTVLHSVTTLPPTPPSSFLLPTIPQVLAPGSLHPKSLTLYPDTCLLGCENLAMRSSPFPQTGDS